MVPLDNWHSLLAQHHLPKKRRPSKNKARPTSQHEASTVSLILVSGENAWALRHPRCARDRAEDIEEVRMMIDAGEFEVAQDELRWLLSGCSDCVDAHLLLGELALEQSNDIALARGHFGYVYQLGLRAWRRAGQPVPVPHSQLANRSFHEAGRALAWCLEKLGKPTMADEVVDTLTHLDGNDPLGARRMLEDLRGGDSLPIM